MQRKTVVEEGRTIEKSWEVDPTALRVLRSHEWIEDFPQLLQRDLAEMEQTFPHWILTVGNDANPVSCPNDHEFIVPMNGSLRCLKCGRTYGNPVSSLMWFGMLPVQITGADRVERRIRSKIEEGTILLPYNDQGQVLFILPVIKIVYPSSWPRSQPNAYYISGFFETLGLNPKNTGHSNHMLSNLQMCLFSSWHQMSIRDVIQNRIAPHALALVTLADGRRPHEWFN